jgi:hypothetical protein
MCMFQPLFSRLVFVSIFNQNTIKTLIRANNEINVLKPRNNRNIVKNSSLKVTVTFYVTQSLFRKSHLKVGSIYSL